MEIRVSWAQLAFIGVLGYVAYCNRDAITTAVTFKKV
jgi:hypothetical protein